MSVHHPNTPHKPHHPHGEVEDPEPGLPPIDPDDGAKQTGIPSDPEHDRVVDPEV